MDAALKEPLLERQKHEAFGAQAGKKEKWLVDVSDSEDEQETEKASRDFCSGDKLSLVGLRTHPQYNGEVVELEKWIAAEMQWLVKLPDGTELCVKPKNFSGKLVRSPEEQVRCLPAAAANTTSSEAPAVNVVPSVSSGVTSDDDPLSLEDVACEVSFKCWACGHHMKHSQREPTITDLKSQIVVLQSKLKTLEVWSVEQVAVFREKGQETFFEGKVKFLKEITSIRTAVKCLNEEHALCPEGYCVAYSERKRLYFLIWRKDKEHEALQLFDLTIQDHEAWKLTAGTYLSKPPLEDSLFFAKSFTISETADGKYCFEQKGLNDAVIRGQLSSRCDRGDMQRWDGELVNQTTKEVVGIIRIREDLSFNTLALRFKRSRCNPHCEFSAKFFAKKQDPAGSVDRAQLIEKFSVEQPGLRALPSRKNWRLDDQGFALWSGYHKNGKYPVAWLKVGCLRRLAKEGHTVPSREDVPRDDLHPGAPPARARLFNVVLAPDQRKHSSSLKDLVAIFDKEGAKDTDLAFNEKWSFMTARGWHHKSTLHQELTMVGIQGIGADSANTLPVHHDGLNRMFCYWRVETVLLPRTYGEEVQLSPGGAPRLTRVQSVECFLRDGWTMFGICLASYCQRLIHAKGEDEEIVRRALNPARFADPHKLFTDELTWPSNFQPTDALERLNFVFQHMPQIPQDRAGFEHYCKESKIAWLHVGYIKELVKRGGPFPRRQELRDGGFTEGIPPAGVRKFVSSHCWESEVHPSPSGRSLRRLLKALEKLKAKDTDVAFLDYCSLWQAAKMDVKGAAAKLYFETNSVVTYPERTPEQHREFKFAAWEMNRLYAFIDCEVVVLPEKDSMDKFPVGGDAWGKVNPGAYEKRGWCCSEFSIALACDRVQNLEHPEVQKVLNSRDWPNTIEEYAAMMDEDNPDKKVLFTDSGDREKIKYNFFKMTMGPQRIVDFSTPSSAQGSSPPGSPEVHRDRRRSYP